MTETQYTTVDRIIARLYRELPSGEFNETDIIEWIGEALEFLKVYNVQEQALAFLEVSNWETIVPTNFHMALQLARDTQWSAGDTSCVEATVEASEETSEESSSPCLYTDCQGSLLDDFEPVYYRPYFDLQWEYYPWTMSSVYTERFRPIRLADNTFFNSLVAKEKDESIYQATIDEYTIVGTTQKKFRFSFKEGYVALSFLRNRVDETTGYPLVPDQISFLTAITYYVRWKIAERMRWSGRDGAVSLTRENRELWLRYAKQAKNYAKMPKTVDDYQNMLEETHTLIPRNRRYYGFFGNMGRIDSRPFNDPDYRNRKTLY